LNEESEIVLSHWCTEDHGEQLGRLVMSSTAIRHGDFDAQVVSELQSLWEGEQCLGRLYPQLRKRPQLRELSLRELANVQQRAEHLLAVLKAAWRPARG
jgi:hypothetical protein